MVTQLFIYFLAINFILINSHCFAQNKVESVVKLSESINSEAEEILPILSPSGDSLFFARVFHEANNGGEYSGSDIWLSIFDNNTQSWGKATNQLNQWNDKRNNFLIGFNPKDKIMYLNNAKNPDKGIQFVKRIRSTYWTKPENIYLPGIPKTGYQGLYVSPDYKVILFSMKADNGYGEEDIYVSTKNGQASWTEPSNLGSTINTSESEISPFLSADQKTLYFASRGHGGYGDMDIYMAKRLYDSWTVWSNPINLGEKINSDKFDGYYSVYADSIAFFSSNREGELSDIYEVRFWKEEAPKVRVMQVVDANTINQRDYLNQKDIKDLFDFDKLPSIDIKTNGNISENNVALELIYFLSNKFRDNPEVKMGIKVNVLQRMSTEKMVVEASKIASFIAAEMQKNGISSTRIQYEGVTIDSQNISNEVEFKVIFRFFN